MRYKVHKQYSNSAEQHCAQFKDAADAKFFMEQKAAQEGAMKIAVVYKLYDLDEIMVEIDSMKAGSSVGQASGSQGKGSGPSPFSTKPTPAGMPSKWNKDEEEK